jgi:hypothetical protein
MLTPPEKDAIAVLQSRLQHFQLAQVTPRDYMSFSYWLLCTASYSTRDWSAETYLQFPLDPACTLASCWLHPNVYSWIICLRTRIDIHNETVPYTYSLFDSLTCWFPENGPIQILQVPYISEIFWWMSGSCAEILEQSILWGIPEA